MPDLPYPALHATHGGIWLATPDGENRALGRGEAISHAADTPAIMLNAPLVGQRLGYPELSGLDLLELFAFVHPARFAVPTPKGMAQALGLAPPETDADAALFLRGAAARLLETLETHWPEREGAWASAQALWRLRWTWAPLIAQRLKRPERDERWLFSRLPEWEESSARPQPKAVRVEEAEALARLASLVGDEAEVREGQRLYAAAAAAAFVPRRAEGQPNMLLAEAGTGIGKTLGYLAPASVWAEKADGAVWVSTYTKALQRQLDREGLRLFPDPEERKRRIVVRKGRENYLCLLNLEDALQGGFAGRAPPCSMRPAAPPRGEAAMTIALSARVWPRRSAG
jgi:ATP-dependent DNA helicase DinG